MLLLVAWVGRVIVMLLVASAVIAVLLSSVVDWVTARLKIRRGLAFALLLTGSVVAVFLTLWIKVQALSNNLPICRGIFPRRRISFSID